MTSPNLCFCKYHLVVWENIATTEVKVGKALGSEGENGDEEEISERHSLKKLIKIFRKLN